MILPERGSKPPQGPWERTYRNMPAKDLEVGDVVAGFGMVERVALGDHGVLLEVYDPVIDRTVHHALLKHQECRIGVWQ